MAARKKPPEGKAWTPEKVRQRIKVGLIANRLERHALGLLKPRVETIVAEVHQKKGRKYLYRADGAPVLKFIEYERLVDQAMTPSQIKAAEALLDRCIPKAQDPVDLNLGGNVTVVFRDPTNRPANLQRERKGRASVPGEV